MRALEGPCSASLSSFYSGDVYVSAGCQTSHAQLADSHLPGHGALIAWSKVLTRLPLQCAPASCVVLLRGCLHPGGLPPPHAHLAVSHLYGHGVLITWSEVRKRLAPHYAPASCYLSLPRCYRIWERDHANYASRCAFSTSCTTVRGGAGAASGWTLSTGAGVSCPVGATAPPGGCVCIAW